jgi:hypothetical protein
MSARLKITAWDKPATLQEVAQRAVALIQAVADDPCDLDACAQALGVVVLLEGLLVSGERKRAKRRRKQ